MNINTVRYLRNNKKKTFFNILIIAIGIFTIYFIMSMGQGLINSINKLGVNAFEKAIYVKDPTGNIDEEEKNIKNNINTEAVYRVKIDETDANVLGTTAGTRVVIGTEDTIKQIYNIYKYNIIFGRFPENNNEILIEDTVAKTKGVQCGDYIGNKVNEKEGLEGKFKVVGIYKGDGIVNFAVQDEQLISKVNKNALVILPKENKLNELKDEIKKTENLFIFDFKKTANAILYGVALFGVILVVQIAFVLSVIISNISYLNFLNRRYEYAILKAIAMTKKELKYMIFNEQLYISIFSVVVGLLISFIGILIMNKSFAEANGTLIPYISPYPVAYSLAIPFISLFIVYRKISKSINKMEIVEILDGNE